MAHESFEDKAVAKLLNDNFVSIKVDREERPDLDAIYMNYCQLMTGSGGWPLNLFLTPDQIPIYAATYLPPQGMYQRPSFTTVINHLVKLWSDDREDILRKASNIKAQVSNHSTGSSESVDQFVTHQAVRELTKRFDETYGGFGQKPKFPSPHQLIFLMDYHKKFPSEEIMTMVTKTLDSMYAGGIYDHVGGGFARYSVDNKWLVPHFEKMLYDNALLLRTYVMGWAMTGNELYRLIAYDILRFLKREMHSEKGGFYTALDADSEGVEGKCYVFEPYELKLLLGDQAETYAERFDIGEAGNFEGKSIPNLIGKELSEEDFIRFESMHEKVLDYRNHRIQPGKDIKMLTSVNGMMLTGLAYMYRLTKDPEVLELAQGCAAFIKKELYEDNRLFGYMTDGEVGGSGLLEDYAFCIEGMMELYQATFNRGWLEMAKAMAGTVEVQFSDLEHGGYFMTALDHEALLDRPKEAYDGAVPSGNSVMVMNLMKLSRLYENQMYEKRAEGAVKAFGKRIKQGASHFSYMMIGLLYLQEGTKDLVVAVPGSSGMDEVRFDPDGFFTVKKSAEEDEKKPIDDKITYYVCENYACGKPVHEL